MLNEALKLLEIFIEKIEDFQKEKHKKISPNGVVFT